MAKIAGALFAIGFSWHLDDQVASLIQLGCESHQTIS
jgi:hypothetical protein